ncbi:hypothetical protein WDU94_001710 [Cyamophila willieti]
MDEDSYDNEDEEDEEDQVIDYSGSGGSVEITGGGGGGNGDSAETTGEMDENFNYFQYWRDPIPTVGDVEETLANSTNLLKLSDSFNNLCSLVESPTSPTLPTPPPPSVPSDLPVTTNSEPQEVEATTVTSSQPRKLNNRRRHRLKSDSLRLAMEAKVKKNRKASSLSSNADNKSSNSSVNNEDTNPASHHGDSETNRTEIVAADQERKPSDSDAERVRDVNEGDQRMLESSTNVVADNTIAQDVDNENAPRDSNNKVEETNYREWMTDSEAEEEEDSDSGNEERNRNNNSQKTTTTTTSGISSSNDLDDMSPQIPISSCDQRIVPQELIDYYVKMFHCGTDQNENSDLARHCAFSLPAVALTLGSPNWSLLRPVTKRLACDEHWKVRRMVAASMHELAVIVGPGAATRDLLPVYTDLIKDLDEVRIGALRILSRFLYLLKPEGRLKFLPMFNKFLATDYEWNWRFRAEFVAQLGLSLGYFLPQQIWDYLAPLALLLLSDKVAAVRRVAIDLMDELFVHVSPSLPLTRCLTTTLAEDFAHSASWSHRQTFASLCARLVSPTSAQQPQDRDGGGGNQSFGGADQDEKGGSPPRRSSGPSLPYEVFAMDILPHLIHLARDPVPNVRLCVARTLALNVAPLPFFQPPCPHSEVILETLHTLMNDPDADVRYYATQKPDPSPASDHNTTANTTDTEINRSHTTEDSSSSSSSDSSSPTSKKMMRGSGGAHAHYDYFDDDDADDTPQSNSAWDPTIKQSSVPRRAGTDEHQQDVPKTEDEEEEEGSSSDEDEEESLSDLLIPQEGRVFLNSPGEESKSGDVGACSNSSSDNIPQQQLRRRSRPSGQEQTSQPDEPTSLGSPVSNKIPPPLPVDSPRPRGGGGNRQQQSNARKRQRN